jgi:hypothetical protein
MISDLLQNKVDMSQLVITKALAKTGRHEINDTIRELISINWTIKITRANKRTSSLLKE